MKQNLIFLCVMCLIGSVIIGCDGSRVSVVSFEVEVLPIDINIDIDNSESWATLSPDSPESENGQIKRKWVSWNQWGNQPGPSVKSVQLSFRQDENDDCRNRHFLRLDKETTAKTVVINWPKSKADGMPLSVTIEGVFGKIVFEGELGKPQGQKSDSQATAFGVMTLTPDKQKVQAIEMAFGQKALLDDLATLITINADVTDIEELANCGVTLTLSQAVDLMKFNKGASDVKKLVDSGYAFKGKDIVRLAQHYVSFDQAVAWRNARYNLSADELIYAKQRYLKPETAAAWKKAEYELNLEELYWIKQRYLKPEKATAWKNAGYKLDIEKLYWAKQRYLDPDVAGKWKNAGYKLSLDDLYYAKQRYLHPEKAAVWKKAGYALNLEQLYYTKQHYLDEEEALAWKNNGYDFSLEELYQLKQHYVKASYGAIFADPNYQRLDVKQLIELKRNNISAETVKHIRKKAD